MARAAKTAGCLRELLLLANHTGDSYLSLAKNTVSIEALLAEARGEGCLRELLLFINNDRVNCLLRAIQRGDSQSVQILTAEMMGQGLSSEEINGFREQPSKLSSHNRTAIEWLRTVAAHFSTQP